VDLWGAAVTATVTLTVTQWASITDALGEQFFCYFNGSIAIPKATLLANDYDSDGDPLSIVAFDTSVLMGSLDCKSDPTRCTYRPPINGSGFTYFRYTASDPAGHRDTATVRIYVGVFGNPPVANDDVFTTTRNTARSFTIQEVVQNDIDPDGDTLTVILNSGARDYGSLSCSSPMYQCTYTPMNGFIGPDRFGYFAWDTLNPQAAAAITVLTLPPAAPTFDAREDLRYTGQNQQTYISYGGLTGNDYDPERDPITVTAIDTAGLQGTLNCDPGGCLYQPPSYFGGVTKFKYTATDGHGSVDTAIVRLRVGSGNREPVAAADSFTVRRGSTLTFSIFDLLGNDYDPDNDPLNVTVYPYPSPGLGTISCTTPAYRCTYTPTTNGVGTDTVRYVLSDGLGSSALTDISITVTN
jgi:hypothetical protein